MKFLKFQAMESAASNCDEEQKWEAEEEEEEALSLCDLPVNLIKEENQIQPRNEEDGESQAIKTEEDFNFGSWDGCLSTKPEMCAADEVFFKGQILPLCVSISSDGSLIWCHRQDSQNKPRSESIDHGSLSRFTSVTSSSRSSSTGSSHYSTNSSNSTTVTAATSFNSITSSKSNPNKSINNFNTHPSPKPQIRLSKTRPMNISSSRNQTSSSVWDFFRLGLVRAPELEFHELKIRTNNNNNPSRNSVSRNSSCSSSNSQLDSIKGFLRKGLFSGCKCSVNVVETVPLNKIAVIKSMMIKKKSEKEKAMFQAAMEEKTKLLQEVKIKKKMKEKRVLSRHRTYEWLKELSHAGFVDEA
ncbi:hypothetical protein Golob_007600 [Gossypium lobatum]|uniref:Uncharacterized protein n=2 Tax=Gossypium TaxID=3633 RepID=A0A7J8MCW4_9ROSI|nr:hypothetical protein [Gossypium lobatum]